MTSVIVRVFTSSIYLLTYFSEIKNFRGAGEDLKVSYTPCEECRTPLKYNLMLIWVQITLDAEISVESMPLGSCFTNCSAGLKIPRSSPTPSCPFWCRSVEDSVLLLCYSIYLLILSVLNSLLHHSVGASREEIYFTTKHIIYLLNVSFNNSTRLFLKNWSSNLLKYISKGHFLGWK